MLWGSSRFIDRVGSQERPRFKGDAAVLEDKSDGNDIVTAFPKCKWQWGDALHAPYEKWKKVKLDCQ